MVIDAFFGKEILSRFVDWVEKPSVEAAEFEVFDIISRLSGDLQSLIICLYCLYSELSKIFVNVVIYDWFNETERCDPAHIFVVIHEHFMKWPESKKNTTNSFLGVALVIRSQFLKALSPIAVYFIKLDMISYNFHEFGRYMRSRDCLVGFGWLL